jgi:hypothetical protein
MKPAPSPNAMATATGRVIADVRRELHGEIKQLRERVMLLESKSSPSPSPKPRLRGPPASYITKAHDEP